MEMTDDDGVFLHELLELLDGADAAQPLLVADVLTTEEEPRGLVEEDVAPVPSPLRREVPKGGAARLKVIEAPDYTQTAWANHQLRDCILPSEWWRICGKRRQR
jgi:hypothetical protein